MPANDENSPLKSIDKIPLDYDLFNIKYNAAANYENYKANYVTKSSFGCEIKYISDIYHSKELRRVQQN